MFLASGWNWLHEERKERRFLFKYNFFFFKQENILPIQKIVLKNGSGFRKVRR